MKISLFYRITAKIGWIQEGRTDFSSARRARITGQPAMPISRVVWSRRRCEQPDSAVAAQTKQHTCLCRSSETAILVRNSVATQTQQGNGQCRGRERIPNSESRTRNAPFPSTRVAREGDYHTGRRLSGSSGSFCCLSVF